MGKNSLGNNANDDFNHVRQPERRQRADDAARPQGHCHDAAGRSTRDLITSDSVEFHNGKKIILPKGSTYSWAMETLERLQRDEETEIRLDRKFNFRPNDGAVAAAACSSAATASRSASRSSACSGTRSPSTPDGADQPHDNHRRYPGTRSPSRASRV